MGSFVSDSVFGDAMLQCAAMLGDTTGGKSDSDCLLLFLGKKFSYTVDMITPRVQWYIHQYTLHV